MKSKSRRYRRGRNAEAEAQYDLNSKNSSDPVGWRLKTFSFLRHSQMYVLTNTRTRIKVCSSLKRCILGFSPFLRMNVLLPIHTNVAWENSRHLATLPLVSPANDVWETSAEIPYWWHVTTQDLGSASDWSCRVGNWLQPIRSTIQICLVTRHQYWTEFLHSFRFSDVISQGNQWWRLEMSAAFSTSFPGFSPTRPTERERERPWTSVFQGLSLSRSVGRVGENPGNEVAVFSG